ncbi:hypothetical protein BAE44_0020838, partial [Dichanthelium oligosanthes]
LVLKFCVKIQCDAKHECYCCMNEKPEPFCYETLRECQAECPLCNPTCPPVQQPTASFIVRH